MSIVTVAVVQAGSPLFDTAAAVRKAERYIREAAAEGARLVVLPEAFIGGYPKGLDFEITVGARTPAGREQFRRYSDAAVNVPGEETDILAELGSELGIDIVVGVIERDGGTLYCTAMHAKGVQLWCAPTVDDREVWASTMTHIALEGRCFVLSANQYLTRAHFDLDGVGHYSRPDVFALHVNETAAPSVTFEP